MGGYRVTVLSLGIPSCTEVPGCEKLELPAILLSKLPFLHSPVLSRAKLLVKGGVKARPLAERTAKLRREIRVPISNNFIRLSIQSTAVERRRGTASCLT